MLDFSGLGLLLTVPHPTPSWTTTVWEAFHYSRTGRGQGRVREHQSLLDFFQKGSPAVPRDTVALSDVTPPNTCSSMPAHDQPSRTKSYAVQDLWFVDLTISLWPWESIAQTVDSKDGKSPYPDVTVEPSVEHLVTSSPAVTHPGNVDNISCGASCWELKGDHNALPAPRESPSEVHTLLWSQLTFQRGAFLCNPTKLSHLESVIVKGLYRLALVQLPGT